MKVGTLKHKHTHFWRYGFQAGTVLYALVVDQPKLAEEHGEHAEVLLQLAQPVLVRGGVVRHPIRQLKEGGRRRRLSHMQNSFSFDL